MNILVVDDEQVIVLGMIARLQKLKDIYINCVGCNSGLDALEIMEDFIPDLLITDLKMPNMDGIELIEKVRAQRLCERIIVLTAYEEFEYARQALRLHVADYMLKPIDWEVLEKYIREMDMVPLLQEKVDRVLQNYGQLFIDIRLQDLTPALRKIICYIDARFYHDISLTHLSIYSGISENSICNLFRKELDITFLDYVHQLRLKKAMELLVAEPGKNIKEIAAQVGYRSERQFFRLFKNKLDMTPQQFRTENLF